MDALKKAIKAAADQAARAAVIAEAVQAGQRSLIPADWSDDGSLDAAAHPRFSTRANGRTYNDTQQLVSAALYDRVFPGGASDDNYLWIVDMTDDWAIYQCNWDGDYFQVTYSIDDNGAVTLGEPVVVQRVTAYEPVESKSAKPGKRTRRAAAVSTRELRTVTLRDVQIRAGADDNTSTFVGYASVTGEPYDVTDWLGSYREPLALDTPVATATGWSSVGDLQVGDSVFGSDGQLVPVESVTPIFEGHDCYRVTFNDGEQIIASGRHGWTLERQASQVPRWEVVTTTTEQMATDCRSGKRGAPLYRVRNACMDLPEADLTVEPYLLGLWLGDGAAGTNWIAVEWGKRADIEVALSKSLESWERLDWKQTSDNGGMLRIVPVEGTCMRGHVTSETKTSNTGIVADPAKESERRCRECRRNRAHEGVGPSGRFVARLRGLGILHDKHIPVAYLRAGTVQREALLQGLIDSDGSVNPHGQVSFVNTNAALIEGICELLTSLGHRWSVAHVDRGNGHDIVNFTPASDVPVARLPHKVARQHAASSLAAYHYVVNVERVESVPVRCIGIETDDHLFQVGRHGVLTHNTIKPGAFVKTLREAEVPLLFNHDGMPVACYRADGTGTMQLAEDGHGLKVEADLDRRQTLTNDLCIALERGDLSKMSFSFASVRDKENWSDDYSEREVGELKLYDASIVTYPANPTTVAGLRNALGHEGRARLIAVGGALTEMREGKTLSAASEKLIRTALAALQEADEAIDTGQESLTTVLGDPPAADADDKPADPPKSGDESNPTAPDDGAGTRALELEREQVRVRLEVLRRKRHRAA